MPETPRAYVVKQLVYDHQGERNEHAASLEDLVTHHPRSNRRIRMQDAEIVQAEDMLPGYRGGNRSYAFIGGEFQEVIDSQSDRYRNLTQDQVLISKDFILEAPQPVAGRSARAVDVPSPIDGYINAVNRNAGFVEIIDRQGGEVIARIRHMSGITVNPGDSIEYGQSLGTQNNMGLNLPVGRAVHVHLDMDTRYFQQYENYIRDLSEGRLPVQAELRDGVLPRQVVDDGVARLGESSDRVRDVQTALSRDGYRAAGDQPIEINGIYRPEIQGAVIAFQQDHGLVQTGDIDLATWQQATHINQRTQLGPVEGPQPEQGPLGNRIMEGLRNDQELPLAPGDPRFGLLPPSDPARTGRQPQWKDHAEHTQPRPRALNEREQAAPTAPQGTEQTAPAREAGPAPDPRMAPPRQGALLLDDPTHPNHGMYATLLEVVHARDRQMGREPDHISAQLAGGLVVEACNRGLGTIRAACFTADGGKVGMTDTPDIEAPWAKTAVGDVARLTTQPLQHSSEQAERIHLQQTQAQSLASPVLTQGVSGPEEVGPKTPRLG